MTYKLFSSLLQPLCFASAEFYYSLKRASRYTPFIRNMTQGHISEYAVVLTEDAKGSTLNVYDTHKGRLPYPLCIVNERIFFFRNSWLLKSLYKLYQPVNITTHEKDEGNASAQSEIKFELVATIKAGLHKSSVRIVRAHNEPQQSTLGYHEIARKVDFWDNYRQFILDDGAIYQWTCKGKWLEKVENAGQKESEVRERIAEAESHGSNAFTIRINEAKISRDVAISTALCSFLEQWK